MEVVKININGRIIGIIGLKTVLAEMAKLKDKFSEEELKEKIFQRLKRENYIPSKPEVEVAYKEAFWREFKKYLEGEKTKLKIRI